MNARGRDLIAYFIAFLTGDGAGQIQGVAIAWTVYQIHHRAFDLGLVGLALFSPSLLLVLVTGHVADRFNRKRTLILTTVIEALLGLVLCALVALHAQTLVLVLCIAVGFGITSAFGSPLEGTILVSLVDSERYLRVQARFSSLRELVVIGAPALGGAIVAVSPAAAIALAAAMTLSAVAVFSTVRVPAQAVAARDATFSFGSALDGFRFIRAHPVVLGAISLDLFAVLFGGATTLLPIYADAVLHVGAFGFGVLRSAGGIGAAAMALALSRRPPARRIGRTLLVAVAAYGTATLVFAYSRSFWLSVAALAAAGAFDMISVVIRHGLVQLNTPDAMRGRVNAVEMVFIGASNELGVFESGTLAQFIGAVPAVALGGLATLAIVGLWSVVFADLRRSDGFVQGAEPV